MSTTHLVYRDPVFNKRINISCIGFARMRRSSPDYSCGMNRSNLDASCETTIPSLDYLCRIERSSHDYSSAIGTSSLDYSHGMKRSSLDYYNSYGIRRSSPERDRGRALAT